MKTYFKANSPDLPQAKIVLKEALGNKQDDAWIKARIPLLCGGMSHIMQIPVYGKNCMHVEVIFNFFRSNSQRVELSCYVQQISVGPEFEWICPLCHSQCFDDIPVIVDKLMLGVAISFKPNTRAKFFQLMEDGQICDNSETDSDSESEDGFIAGGSDE
jgi:hypothetical protein